MTHKIAIITTAELYYNYGDDRNVVVDSITDWTEVSDEEFKMLSVAQNSLGFTLLEQPTDVPKFVAKTVADYLQMVENQKKKDAEEKLRREEAALQRKIKKEAKDQKTKLAMLKKLSDELGVPLAPNTDK
jgi:hypothetical protein